MSKELFWKALKCKNKKQEAKKKEIEQKKSGWEIFRQWYGVLKQDKQERRGKLWTGKLEGDLGFTLSNLFHC